MDKQNQRKHWTRGDTAMKINAPKGRAYIHWVNKHPIDKVNYYPSQLIDVYGEDNPAYPASEPTYENFISGPNLILSGDNAEILSSLLVQGFSNKIDLIYIDPPFASGADYVRKVQLRGRKEVLEGEEQSTEEQRQYADIWANDNYLQFMYERLLLMRELLSNKGSIYLHCDQTFSHYLKIIMDEVFGENNFVNEIIWVYRRWSAASSGFQNMHDTIFFYSKNQNSIFNSQYVATSDTRSKMKRGYNTNTYLNNGERKKQIIVENREVFDKAVEQGKIDTSDYDRIVYREQEGTLASDVFEIPIINPQAKERFNYPTQKPEALIERIIKASSNEDSIVLDCFAGSGTTAVVAEKLGRRWIVADMNKGAIQTTIKRIQTCIDNPKNFAHYCINNYNARTHLELEPLVKEMFGIQADRQDLFFDGRLSGTLVKIIDLAKPLTRLDIQNIRDELKNRPDESRNITVFCNGSELEIQAELDKENKKDRINKIIVCDIQKEGLKTYDPAEAEVDFKRERQNITIKILEYINPTICARLNKDRTVFDEHIEDFRTMIDYVQIDTDYKEDHFTMIHSDIPEKHKDFIKGEYTLPIPHPDACVAVKIVSMLGEETIITE